MDITDIAKERLWPMVSRWGQARLTGSDLTRADDELGQWYHHDVHWEYLQMLLTSEISGMDVSSGTYWGPIGPDGNEAPRSVLAFCGLETRLRLAADPSTPMDKLDLMAGDWEQRVRDAVFATGRMSADDPRARRKNISIAEARVLLQSQIEKMRHTEHEHEWWVDPFSGRRECTKCGVEYEPYEHPHDWFERKGELECRICGITSPAT